MIRLKKSLLAALLLASLAGRARAASFIEYGSPAYTALKTAVERVNEQGWVADRIKKSQPITEMTAKQLAKALLLNTGLAQSYKQNLEAAFPQETRPVDERYTEIGGLLKDMDESIKKVTAKLDIFEAAMRKGLLSGRSRPSVLFNINAGLFGAEEWRGLGGHRGWRGGPGSGIWTEWTTGGDGYSLYFVMEFYPQWFNFYSAHLEFFFDNMFLPGIEVMVANEDIYPSMSTLIFSGGAGFHDDFGNINELSGRKDLVKSSPGFGARGGQDIYIRRKSSGDWWPFSDTQFIATQTYNYYFGNHLNDVALNVKVRGMPLFWPLERADPAFTFLWSFNDEADINGWKDLYPPSKRNSSAQAFALNSQLAGGGTLYFEAATAEWQDEFVPKSYRDMAVLTVLSKSIGTSALVLDFQHTGPEFFAGTRQEPSGNFIGTVIDDPRPGRAGQMAWITNAEEPTAPAANSEHLGLGATMDFTMGSVGLFTGTNIQINPSGPWLRSRHMIGWPGGRLETRNGSHGFRNGVSVPEGPYNTIGGTADYQGSPVSVLWTELMSPNGEQLILTKDGVGDNRMREDSIKYCNFFDLRGDLNVQSMFDLKRPFLLKFASRIRNTDETYAFPMYTDKTFLMQMASSVTVNFELPAHYQVVTAVGYEDWLSRATFVPVDYHTTWALLEINKDFPEIMSNFSIGPRIVFLRHYDSNNEFRNFHAWNIGMGTSTTF